MKNRLTHLRTGLCCWAAAVCLIASPAKAQVKEITLENGTKLEELTFSPDGNTIVGICTTVNKNIAEVRQWDLRTGKPLGLLGTMPERPKKNISFTMIAFSSDSKFIACADHYDNLLNDGEKIDRKKAGVIKVWDFQTKKQILELNKEGFDIRNLTFLAKSHVLYAQVEGKQVAPKGTAIRFWNAETGEQIGDIPTGASGIFELEKWLVTISNGKIQYWNSKTRKEKKSFSLSTKQGGIIFSVLFRGNGNLILTSLNHLEDRPFRGELFNLKTHKNIREFEGPNYSMFAIPTISTDGKLFATCLTPGSTLKDQNIRKKFDPKRRRPETSLMVWDITTGKLRNSFKLNRGSSMSKPFFIDEKHLLINGVRKLEVRNSVNGNLIWPMRPWLKTFPSFELDSHTFLRSRKTLLVGGRLVLERDGKYSFSPPKVYKAQIKIIDLKAFLKKAAADEKRNEKIN